MGKAFMPHGLRFEKRVRTIAWAVCGFVTCFLALGCGKGDVRIKPTQTVTGRILFDGKSRVGANVYLVQLNEPIDPWARPQAEVGPDGSFAIGTYQPKDGAPAGEYALTVSWWPPESKTPDGPVEAEKAGKLSNPMAKVSGGNRLPMRYSTPEGSPIPKVTVRDQPIELGEINLTNK